jgi:hypothetical protein
MTTYIDPLVSATDLTLGTTQTNGTTIDLEAVYDGLLMITTTAAGGSGTWGWRGLLDNVNWYGLGGTDRWSGDFYVFGSTEFLHAAVPARYVYVTGIAESGSPVVSLAQVVHPVG